MTYRSRLIFCPPQQVMDLNLLAFESPYRNIDAVVDLPHLIEDPFYPFRSFDSMWPLVFQQRVQALSGDCTIPFNDSSRRYLSAYHR